MAVRQLLPLSTTPTSVVDVVTVGGELGEPLAVEVVGIDEADGGLVMGA